MANRKNRFLIKRSNVPNKVPTNGSLLLGELGLNTADVILYASGTTEGSILPIGWDRINRTGDTMTGTLYGTSFSASTFSGGTYYGDGSNLSGTSAFIEVDEGDGPGFVIRTQDRTNHNIIGYGSLDLSVGDTDLIPRGIDGQQSIANGYNLLGDGYASITMGWDNVNHGNYSFINGISNRTSGGGVMMVGVGLDSTGGDVMGVFGQANTLPTGNPYHFQIGNGTLSSTTFASVTQGVGATGETIGTTSVYDRLVPSDSFRVYKTGDIEAPSLTIPMIDAGTGKWLVTKEWVEGLPDVYITGSTLTGSTDLVLTRNDGVNIVQDMSKFEIDNFTTATTVVDKTVYFDRTDTLSAYTMDLSGFSKNSFVGVQLSEKAVGKGAGFADEGLLDNVLSVVLFDDGITESMLFSTIVTLQADLTENPRVAFTLLNTDVPVVTTSDTIYWEIDCRYISEGQAANKSIDETLTGTITFTGGTTNSRQSTGTIDLDASLMTEGDIASFVIRRVPTNAADNYTGDAAVSSTWWIYKEKDVLTLV